MTKSDKLWKQVEMYLGDTLWPVQMNDELKAILAWGTLTLQKKNSRNYHYLSLLNPTLYSLFTIMYPPPAPPSSSNSSSRIVYHRPSLSNTIHHHPSLLNAIQHHVTTTTTTTAIIFQLTIHGQTCLVRTSEPSGAELATCLVELPFFFFPFFLFFFLDFPFPPFFLGWFFNLPVLNFFVFDLAVSLFTKPFLFLDSPFLLALAFLSLDFEPPVFFRFWLILLPIFLEGEPSWGASSGSTEGRCFGPFVPLTPHTAMQYLLRNTLFSKISYKMNDILNIHCWTKELTAFLPIIELVIGGTFWVGNKTLARSVNVTNKTKCD